MTPKTLSTIGTFTEVAYFRGQWYVAWQEETSLRVLAFASDLGPATRPLDLTLSLGPDAGAFPRMLEHDNALRLVYRMGAPDYTAVLVSLTNDDAPRALGVAHGNDPLALGHGFVAWQAAGAPDYPVLRQPIDGSAPEVLVRQGAPDGLSRILPDGSVTLIKDENTAIPGYTRPCWAGDAVVVEADNPVDSLCDLIIRSDGQRARAFLGQNAPTPRLATNGAGRYLVGTGQGPGARIALIEPADFQTPSAITVAPLSRPALISAFFATSDQYPETTPNYPRHADVIVEATGAANRAPGSVIVGLNALATVQDPTRVVGLYAGTEDLTGLELECRALREAWTTRWPDRPRPPVIAYLAGGASTRAGYPPREPDIYAPECYFGLADMSTAAGVEALVAGWMQTLPADRPWLLTCQAYDRNDVWTSSQMAALAAASPAYLDALRARPWILGLMWFAVNRPGGVRDYPALLEAHRAIFAAVPGAAALPMTPVTPPPSDEDDMTITIGKYDETGKVGQPARIAFTLNSDHPVTELTIDRIGDGVDGLTISGKDLRPLRALEVLITKAGKSAWQLRGKDSAGGHDETSDSSRPFVAQA